MAAKRLEWESGKLCIAGGRMIGEVRWRPDGHWEYDLWRGTNFPEVEVSGPYERQEDCAHDLESEVRRLLKDTGVEVA